MTEEMFTKLPPRIQEMVKKSRMAKAAVEALDALEPEGYAHEPSDDGKKHYYPLYNATQMILMFNKGREWQKEYAKSPEGKLMDAIFGDKED